MGKQMFSYHAIDLLRDIPQHLKDLIFLFQRNKTLFAVRTIPESNLNRNFIINYNLIMLLVPLPLSLSFFLLNELY